MNAEAFAEKIIPQLLSSWLDESVEEVHRAALGPGQIGLEAPARGLSLLVETRRADRIPLLEGSRRALERQASESRSVFIVAVPFMGPKAREYARSVGLSWMDLSGNADIRGPGLRILVEGQPNRFASPGRPSTAFSDKAARLSRGLLAEPERWWQQRELAKAVGISTGYVSKVVARLSESGLLELGPDGRLRPKSPTLLLDAWAQVYDFRKHDIARFHAVGRTGPGVTESLAGRLSSVPNLTWAATGLSAAWALSHFADHRLTTFYVSRVLPDAEELGLRPVEEGENVWLVLPRDDGVFHGVKEASGLRCVSPVQVYLDLLAHPERASEAAEHLRTHAFGWSTR